MAVTHTFTVGRAQCFQQIEKLTKSHSLHSSESLCKLLRYLAEHSLDHPGVALKEYQIATEVLGRPAGFDPQSDSTVRVQAGRLRLKLAEYYSHEGPDDSVIVELPKGSYSLTFHVRTPGGQLPASLTLEQEIDGLVQAGRDLPLQVVSLRVEDDAPRRVTGVVLTRRQLAEVSAVARRHGAELSGTDSPPARIRRG